MTGRTARANLADRVTEAAESVRTRLRAAGIAQPAAAIILGSGLGNTTRVMNIAMDLAYTDIPHFSHTGVAGHAGRLLGGEISGHAALFFAGRLHGYEGFSPKETTFAVRVASALEIKTLVVTNAAGAIHPKLKPGDLVAISDHINLTGVNPAAGNADPRLGPRFFDMTVAYSPRLRAITKAAAHSAGWELAEGVYLGVQGPSFETPAEIRAFRALGADLVGMSTVHEVIIARQLGLEVQGISCVTNMAAGILNQPLSHAEVIQASASVADRLGELLAEVVPRIAEE